MYDRWYLIFIFFFKKKKKIDKNDLWTFGIGLYGQTALGKIVHKLNYPLNVSKISKKKFIKVAPAESHVLAIGGSYTFFQINFTMDFLYKIKPIRRFIVGVIPHTTR